MWRGRTSYDGRQRFIMLLRKYVFKRTRLGSYELLKSMPVSKNVGELLYKVNKHRSSSGRSIMEI